MTWTPDAKHTIDFGFEAKDLDFKLDYYVVDMQYRNRFSGRYFSFYAQDHYKLDALNHFQAGVRLDHYTDGHYWRLAPRLSLQHLFQRTST